MVSDNQPDLFQTDDQSDLFGEDTPTPEYRADPNSVRAELYKKFSPKPARRKSCHGSRRRFCSTEPSSRR